MSDLDGMLKSWHEGSASDPVLTYELAEKCYHSGWIKLSAFFLRHLLVLKSDLPEVARILDLIGEPLVGSEPHSEKAASQESVLSESEIDIDILEVESDK